MDIKEMFKNKICQENCQYQEQCSKDCIEIIESKYMQDPEITLHVRCLKYKQNKVGGGRWPMKTI